PLRLGSTSASNLDDGVSAREGRAPAGFRRFRSDTRRADHLDGTALLWLKKSRLTNSVVSRCPSTAAFPRLVRAWGPETRRRVDEVRTHSGSACARRRGWRSDVETIPRSPPDSPGAKQ